MSLVFDTFDSSRLSNNPHASPSSGGFALSTFCVHCIMGAMNLAACACGAPRGIKRDLSSGVYHQERCGMRGGSKGEFPIGERIWRRLLFSRSVSCGNRTGFLRSVCIGEISRADWVDLSNGSARSRRCAA